MISHLRLPFRLGQVLVSSKPSYSGKQKQSVFQLLYLVLALSITVEQHNHVCRQQSAIDLKIIFEAAWAVTNLAAGPRECVEAVLPAAPLLILLLRTHSSSHIAEQSAWALGKSFVQCLVRLRLLSKAESLPTCIMYTVMSHMRGSLQLDESMPQQDGQRTRSAK